MPPVLEQCSVWSVKTCLARVLYAQIRMSNGTLFQNRRVDSCFVPEGDQLRNFGFGYGVLRVTMFLVF